MRIAYLDCFSGISGDMFLGALVDAGVPFTLLEQTTAALNIGASLESRKVVRGGITGTKVDVLTPELAPTPNPQTPKHTPPTATSPPSSRSSPPPRSPTP